MLLQLGSQGTLGLLQVAAQGVAVVTDIEGQEEAVAEPEDHVGHRLCHGPVAAKACEWATRLELRRWPSHASHLGTSQ